MRYLIGLLAFSTLLAFQLEDQIWIMDKGGSITFSTTLETGEKVEGKSERLGSIFRVNDKNINISIPIASFVFEESGLIDQFSSKDYLNEKASASIVFNGTIPKAEMGQFNKDRKYDIEGELIIAGKPKQVIEQITLVEKDGTLTGSVTFTVDLKDHGITLDDVMKTQFGEEFTLTGQLEYKELKFDAAPKN
jgi:polyisoprenoid-binding protein YceI